MMRVMTREVDIKNLCAIIMNFDIFAQKKWIKLSENFTSLINRFESKKVHHQMRWRR